MPNGAEDFAAAARLAAQNATGEADMTAQWASYFEELKKSDPEEYKLLMEDMANFVEQKKESERIVTREEDVSADFIPKTEDKEFAPRMPGIGGKVLGQKGVTESEDQEGLRIVPTPGFVIKTRTDKDEKIFINVCQSEAVQKTSTRKQLAEDGSEQEGLHVPLSLGPPREDRDNAGKSCLVYDVIVNPDVVKQARDDKSGASRSFLCEVALGYVETKYKCSVDYKYKLPKLAYKGNKDAIPAQYVRKKHTPVIEEVSEGATPMAPSLASSLKSAEKSQAAPPVKPQQLAYSLKRWEGTLENAVPCEAVLTDPTIEAKPLSEEPKGILFEATLERAVGMPQVLDRVRIDCSSEVLSLQVDGYYLPLELFLPMQIDPASVNASIDANTMQLKISLEETQEHEAWRTSTKPDIGSRPWLLASAIAMEDDAQEQDQNLVSGSAIEKLTEANAPDSVSKATDNNEDDALPEDRFHLSDMLSVHIKEERERERQEKFKRHEEEEVRKAEEEERKKAAEKQANIENLLAQAEAELSSVTKAKANSLGVKFATQNSTAQKNFMEAEDLDDLLV